MDVIPAPKRWKRGLRPDQRLCPHCNQVLSYKTFITHKRLHYDSETNKWNHERHAEVTDAMDEESPPSSPNVLGLEHSDVDPDLPGSGSGNIEEPPLSDPGSLSDDTAADGELTYYNAELWDIQNNSKVLLPCSIK